MINRTGKNMISSKCSETCTDQRCTFVVRCVSAVVGVWFRNSWVTWGLALLRTRQLLHVAQTSGWPTEDLSSSPSGGWASGIIVIFRGKSLEGTWFNPEEQSFGNWPQGSRRIFPQQDWWRGKLVSNRKWHPILYVLTETSDQPENPGENVP